LAYISPVKTLHGQKLHIKKQDGKVNVSSAELVEPDIYASNGVVHTVSSLLIPPGALELTPEKFLLTLNCTSFVSLLHSVGLQGLVNDTEAQYTILAPRDDVLSIYSKDEDLPESGSLEMKRLLQYHFLPGHWTPSKLKDGMLVQTALEEPGLAGGNQVMDVEVISSSYKDDDPKIRFAGASVVGRREFNNTVIYFVSRPLTPPVDGFNAALPILDLSSFLAAVSSTSLSKDLYTQPRTTLLIPNNDAFKRLGALVSDYLLRASSKSELEKLILHHAINGVEYADSLVNGSTRTYATLEGTDVDLDRMANGSVFLSGSGGWSGMTTALAPRNLLTQTGVLHELSDLMIPRSVDITVGKLARAAKASTMLSLVTKAGMEWVLNGTAPPENSTWDEAGLSGAELTLLCPSDDAFKQENLTVLYDDVPRMRALVEQHIIPGPAMHQAAVDMLNNNRPLRLADDASYETALSTSSLYGGILFRATSDGGYIVGIRDTAGTDGRSDWARVVSWGRTTAGRRAGGVILIDQLLEPYHPPWYKVYAGPVASGVFGFALICAFFYLVRWVWTQDATVATYEPIGQNILGQ
jgi:solute carrier family 25 carnitine/acylcarnitine transporter 20/29